MILLGTLKIIKKPFNTDPNNAGSQNPDITAKAKERMNAKIAPKPITFYKYV